MKASEVIRSLANIMAQDGDFPVVVNDNGKLNPVTSIGVSTKDDTGLVKIHTGREAL